MHDSTHEYDENCPGCQPALYDMKNKRPMPEDDPAMVIVLKAFKEKCNLTQRRAWHRIAMGQSNNEKDQQIFMDVANIIEEALTEFENGNKSEETT